MTQEEKELLFKDLCARIPYGVKLYCTQGTSIDRKKGWKLVGYHEADIKIKDVFGITVGTLHRIILNCVGPNNNVDIDFINDEVKPYLFPLSSMTEEQKKFFSNLPIGIDKYGDISTKDDLNGNSLYTDLESYLEVIEWLNKNHFDYRGLIEKGLALDATDKNIY